MSEADLTSLVRTVDKLELPTSRQKLFDLLEVILSKPYIHRVSISEDGIEVIWFRSQSDTLIPNEYEEEPESILGRINLEEHGAATEEKAHQTLCTAMLKLTMRNLVPTVLFCRSKRLVKSWLSIDELVMLPKHSLNKYEVYLGMQLVETDFVNENTIVVGGAPLSTGSMAAVTDGYSVRMGE